MATKQVLIVFVLPVIISVIFGSAVFSDILQNPDRELKPWSISSPQAAPASSTLIEIMGLSAQYSTSEPVEIQVKISDSSFDCGDLYITIYSLPDKIPVTQGGFFEQCLESGNKVIPIGDEFSKLVDIPGSYEITAEMISKQLTNISTKGTFTVK